MTENSTNQVTQEKTAPKKSKKNLIRSKICKRLIEKCGFKFFIKYYYQIKDLPFIDIEITENYTIREKRKRIRAVKKIITRNHTLTVAKEILSKYSKYLSESEKNKLTIIFVENF